ncbi:hypothetical protein FQV27_15625 [Paracoccus aurantiacus]|uniref:Uncharacterized protein n=1 Tax=Paracoccus aurantiacus TaxID=2599412 RepID=A0A5C6S1L1_9RHOB|nr:hypothetical protein [Paracoccus aurantiacus]TXB67522.1 hypothetical protein FQV27_15625 [Paracoccus aurantiacus]
MSRFADVTTDTPHGPRPVPRGHVSDDDHRVYDGLPRSTRSPSSRWLVWGGVGIAAAATTAFSIMATRAVVHAIAGDDEDRPHPRPHSGSVAGPRMAPRYAAMSPEDRARVRARARADMDDFDERAEKVRRAALKKRRQQRSAARRSEANDGPGFFDNLSSNATKLATNIGGLITAANAAVEGFQQVSGRADGIVRDFTQAADRLRGYLDTRSSDARDDNAPEPRARDERTASQGDVKRNHNL